jgi:DNA-binding SARP family transcriptional activator/tetratricopeptide (TPR) repeat protein
MLRVRLVGGPSVEVDGAEAPAPASKRAWGLLAWLALNPGEHQRSEVAAAFWPDVLDQSARASLRTAIWAIRQGLGDPASAHLACTREQIGLEDAWVDVAEAKRLAAGGEREAAVELAGGELLPGFDDDWALRARDEHREWVIGLLEQLAADSHDAPAAVAWTRRQASLDPLGEEVHRRLMERLAAAGDRSAALAVFARLAERLRRELGVAPSEATRALARRLRGGEAGTPVAAPARTLPLVGRDREMRALVAAWEAARSGLGGVVTVHGEPGVGKTRIAQELARHAAGSGARVAAGTALDLAGGAPFGIWAELLRELVRDLPPAPGGAAWPGEAARLVPELGTPATPAAPDVERARLLEAVASLVEWAGADRPALLVVEDAHAADAASLELTAYVGRRLTRLPVLLVMTRRELPLRPEVDALEHELRARGALAGEFALGPLGRADVKSLALAVASLGTGQVEAVANQAEGNALIAVETARALARGESGPAASLRGTVRAAFRALGPGGREVAELAAIAARPLDRAVLAELGVEHPAEAASDALGTGLMSAPRAGVGYRHALLRDAAYADLPEPRRAELHERVAHALAARPDARRAGEAARHFRLAGRDDLALGQLVRAASHARSVAALEQAAALLEEALTIEPDSASILVELAEVEAWRGRRQASEDAFARALPLLEHTGGLALADALMRQARWYHGPVCYPPGVAKLSTRVLDLLDQMPGDHTARRGEALAALAWAEAVAGDLDRADELIAEVANYSELAHDDVLFPYNLNHAQALALIRRGRFEEAYAPSILGGETADSAGRPDLAYGCWINAAGAAAAAGDNDRALGFMDRAQASMNGRGILGIEVQILAARASILQRMGRAAEARSCTAAEGELAELAGDGELAAIAAHDGGLAALETGDYDEAERLLREALEGGANVSRPLARLARAEALARLGRCADAEVELRATALEPVGPADFPDTLVPRLTRVQGLIAAARGDHGLAERRLEEAADGWRRRVTPSAGERLTAALADFGRPVIGLVDPALELERVSADLRALEVGV